MNKQKVTAALYSYGRAALSCVAALYMSGITDPKVLANALIASLIAPILKGVDPKESHYGVGSK